MKLILFFCTIVWLFSCATIQDKEKDEKNINIPITRDDVQAVKKMQQQLAAMFNITSRSENIPLIGPILVIDSSELRKLPYYDFDEKGFYEDPSPENIIKNLTVSNDLFFAIMKNDSIKSSLLVKKAGESWTLGGFTKEWGRVISWLPEKISMADNKEYKIFNIGAGEVVVYYKDGKPVFHRITGEEYSGNTFCGMLLEMHEIGVKNTEYLRQQELIKE